MLVLFILNSLDNIIKIKAGVVVCFIELSRIPKDFGFFMLIQHLIIFLSLLVVAVSVLVEVIRLAAFVVYFFLDHLLINFVEIGFALFDLAVSWWVGQVDL